MIGPCLLPKGTLQEAEGLHSGQEFGWAALGCLSWSLGNLCIPAAQMCWQTGDVLHNARVCLGRGDKDKAPPEQGRHWGGTQLLSAGDGEGGSWPLHTVRSVWGRVSILILSRWSPSSSAVRGTRRRGVGLWPHCGRRFRRSHLQVPPLPGVSSLAVIGVSVWQSGGRLGAGLDCLHPLLQAATWEHHVAGADTLGPWLPQVLLAVPDAIAKVDE